MTAPTTTVRGHRVLAHDTGPHAGHARLYLARPWAERQAAWWREHGVPCDVYAPADSRNCYVRMLCYCNSLPSPSQCDFCAGIRSAVAR